MQFALPIILLVLGVLLVLPLLRMASLLANAGTPDATAVSTSLGMLIQGGVGILLAITGLVLLIIRISRRGTTHSA